MAHTSTPLTVRDKVIFGIMSITILYVLLLTLLGVR